MLFTAPVLELIRAGRITVAFRRWKRPTVRAGGRLRTLVGELAIRSVDVIDAAAITMADAKKAGYESPTAVVDDLAKWGAAPIHRITFRYDGADRRVALRECTDEDETQWLALITRLDRIDARSGRGPWTSPILRLISGNEGVRAAELAPQVDREVEAFKRDVRVLKNLGLTESLGTGYRLSPRGRALLMRRTR